jgi:hypothetical protein
MSKRSARRDENFDLFVPRMNELPLKDQREMMERPFFSLAKRKRLKAIEYESPDGEIRVHVSGNPTFGIATIWDADILIWAASHLNRFGRRARTTSPHHSHHGLRPAQGASSRHRGSRLSRAPGRASAPRGHHNPDLDPGSQAQKMAQFGWLDEWTMEVDPETDAPRGLTITLSNWMFEGILADPGPSYPSPRLLPDVGRTGAGDLPDRQETRRRPG